VNGGLLVRRLLPLPLGLPFVVGLVRLYGERGGLFSSSVGLGIMIAFSSLGGTALLLWTARSVNLLDAERERIADQLRESTDRYRALAHNFPDGRSFCSITICAM
jgi:two-component system, NtrC family, sensor histidine kinase KinB